MELLLTQLLPLLPTGIFFFVTNIVDNSEWQKICIVLRLNVGKKKTRNIEVFSQLSNFQSFNSENDNAFSKKSQRSFVL